MKRILRKSFIWLYILTKRLIKKPIFLLTLLLIPLLSLAMSVFTQQDSAMVRIALYTVEEDTTAEAIIDTLLQQDSVVRFERYSDRTTAIEAVKQGEIDSAWGFVENFTEKLYLYVDTDGGDALIEITEQEESVALKLAREKMYGALVPILSREIYKAYLRNELNYDVDSNQEYVDQTFDEAGLTEPILRFAFVDNKQSIATLNYLSTPIRGIVAVAMIVCGMAAAMVFLKEKEEGVYAYLAEHRQFPLLMGSCFCALLICSVVALVSIWLSGSFTVFSREILMMAFYVFMCTLFCTFLAQICRKATSLAIVLPLVVVTLLVFCPIFFNHKLGMPLQYLLPTYYYLNAVTFDRFVPAMLWYIMGALILCLGTNAFRILSKIQLKK